MATARAVAVGLALATLALVVGPLLAATGPVDRLRGALGRLLPLALLALVASIDLDRSAQLVVIGAVAAVALAPVESRWRALPGVVLLAVVTAGSAADIAVRDRVLGGLHVVAGAVWLGLVVEVVARWAGDPAAGRRLLHRLSAPALVALVAVATTGTLLSSEHLGDARLALGSWWGKGLAVKIALVVLAAVLGALVRRTWAPRLEGTALAGVAVLGVLLAAAGSPLSGATPLGPLFAQDGATAVLVAPLQAGPNTVVVRVPAGVDPGPVEVDGRPLALVPRGDGLLVGEVDLPEGRHRIRVGERDTRVTIGPDEGGTRLRATLPDVVEDPDCLDRLAGLGAAAAALTAADRPVRFELEVGGGTCGLVDDGFAPLTGVWDGAVTSAVAALRARGTAGPLVVVSDGGSRARAAVAALQAAGEEPIELPSDRFDAAVAGTVEASSLVLVATDPAGALPAVQALADATGATIPVVLAPWLLDASVVGQITDQQLTVLLAAHRSPTSAPALSYRTGAAAATGGGWAITAAGFEAYLSGLESLTGGTAEPAVPGVFSAARLAVLPADLSHPSESGWARGVAMTRVA